MEMKVETRRRLHERIKSHDARVVHGAVETAVCVDRLLARRRDVQLGSDIRAYEQGFGPFIANEAHCFLAAVLVDVGHHDFRPLAREGLRSPPAQSTRRAG